MNEKSAAISSTFTIPARTEAAQMPPHRNKTVGGKLGILTILHTWTRALEMLWRKALSPSATITLTPGSGKPCLSLQKSF